MVAVGLYSLYAVLLLWTSRCVAWTAPRLSHNVYMLPRYQRGTTWSRTHHLQHNTMGSNLLKSQVSRFRTIVRHATVDSPPNLELPAAPFTDQTDKQNLPDQLALEQNVDRAEEEQVKWVLAEGFQPGAHSTEISDHDVKLAYECFYNISVASADEGIRILIANTDLFIYKNLTELYARSLEIAPEEHIANLDGGLSVVMAYVESFAESWGRVMNNYRALLGGAVNATRTSAEALDTFVQTNKEDLISPGFGRYLEGEVASVAGDTQVENYLQRLRLRLIAEQEASFPDELKLIPRLLSIPDRAQRESELEYFIRSAKDPKQRVKVLLDMIDSTLEEARSMEFMTPDAVEILGLLEELKRAAALIGSTVTI